MNAAVITKIGYRFSEEDEFSFLDLVPESGTLSEETQQTGAGLLYTTTIEFKIARSSAGHDQVLKSLAARHARYQVTDVNGTVYLAGSSVYPARMLFTRAVKGTSSSFNGYECKITLKSSEGCTVQ